MTTQTDTTETWLPMARYKTDRAEPLSWFPIDGGKRASREGALLAIAQDAERYTGKPALFDYRIVRTVSTVTIEMIPIAAGVLKLITVPDDASGAQA